MADDIFTIARQAINSALNNVLNSRVVPIFFHRSPGNDNGNDRAIPGISWQVRAQGLVIQTGTTAANGRIDMTIRGASSTLELLHNGAVVAEYVVRSDPAPLAGAATRQGQKERLRLLGYHLGRNGPDQNGVDGNVRHVELERSILDHQVEHNQFTDAAVNAAMQGNLTGDAGA